MPGNVATLPAQPMAGPDFSLIGQFNFGFVAKLGILTAVLVVISFMLSDFFDTMGTLIGVGSEAGYLNKEGELEDAQKPLLVDSLGAVAGGLASASSATTYIESAAGVAAGGRTGLVSVVTGILFLLALPFVALVNAIPAVATAPALIVVGVLMVGVLAGGANGRTIDFRNLEDALPVVLTMLVMPLDLQHHQRHRRRLRQLRADQAGQRQGAGGPPGALRGGGAVPALLPALGAVRRAVLTRQRLHGNQQPTASRLKQGQGFADRGA